jgi:hypothetical protein
VSLSESISILRFCVTAQNRLEITSRCQVLSSKAILASDKASLILAVGQSTIILAGWALVAVVSCRNSVVDKPHFGLIGTYL